MYQMCHHHLSDTHNLSDLTSRFIRHMLHFACSIPITIYTLSSRAPTHHYLHTFLHLFTHCTHHLRTAQIVLDIQHHRCGWQLTPILRQKPSINGANITTCKPCQLSAVSCRSFRARGHAFGAFPALQKHHYLHGFCTTDTTSATTTTTHPITLYHIHTPSSRFHHYIHQTPAMYRIR